MGKTTSIYLALGLIQSRHNKTGVVCDALTHSKSQQDTFSAASVNQYCGMTFRPAVVENGFKMMKGRNIIPWTIKYGQNLSLTVVLVTFESIKGIDIFPL